MSKAFRGIDDDETMEMGDESLEGAAEHPPALKFGIGLCEFVFGLFTNLVQAVTSTIGILALIFGTEVSTMNWDGAFKRFGWSALIACIIAVGVQLFLHKNAQPMSSTWRRLRNIQHFNIKSHQSFADVRDTLSIGAFFFLLAVAGDVISDATFVKLFTSNPFVIVFWMLFLTGSSTLLLYDGATRLWGAWEDFKDYSAYHRMHDTTRKDA